jgi:SAM-dependent methyltransferase
MLNKKFQYIKDGYVTPKGIGTPNFSDGIQWANCLVEPFKISSSKTFLDYGCADGRLANFLAAYIDQNFKYYGLEHPDSALRAFSNSIFFADPRCQYGLMGSPIEKEALLKSKYVVLGSVFTHLKFEDFEEIMAKFAHIIKKGGQVVFSVFIKDSYEWEDHTGVYEIKNCISRVYYTEKMIADFALKNDYLLTEHESFLAQGENLHRIFKITK